MNFTLLNFTGFETGADATLTGDTRASAGTGHSFDTGTVRTGAYSFRANCATTENAIISIYKYSSTGQNDATNFNVSHLYTQLYFRYATKPAANDEPFMEFDNDEICALRLNSAGKIALYRGATGATLVATGNTVLSANTWYQIRLDAVIGAAGAYNVYINGVQELTGTANWGTTNWTNLIIGKTANANSQAIDFFFDDVFCDDATYPAGAAGVLAILPTANGATMTWANGTAPSDYTQVDELTINDADYVQSPTTGNPNVALFAMQDCATVGVSGTILGVKVTARMRENTTVTSACLVRVNSGASNSDSGTVNGTTSVLPRAWLALTDPATSVAWTISGVNAMEMGVVENNAVAQRCTQVIGMVAFIPPALPTVTTQAVSSIAATTATGNANITATGGENPSERGVVWSTTSHADPGNVSPASSSYSGLANETGGSFSTGAFTESITGLAASTTYYVRGYAKNSAGYFYGGEVSFTTSASGPANVKTKNGVAIASVKTIDGLATASIKSIDGVT